MGVLTRVQPLSLLLLQVTAEILKRFFELEQTWFGRMTMGITGEGGTGICMAVRSGSSDGQSSVWPGRLWLPAITLACQ